jgi:protein-S-isoprenylcysteine O-methyltransferase Ste14
MAQVTKPARTHLTRQAQPVRIPGLIILLYAVAAYLVFLGVLGYAVGFFAGFGVPKAIDQGPRAGVPLAAAIDLLLLLLFAVQHTVMARPWFKRRWSRFLPPPAERATFVLAASLLLALLFWQWRPIGVKIWSLSGAGADVLWAIYAAGWLTAISSTFLISHFDLFGLRQAWLHARRAAYYPTPFTERGLYGRIRHPLMTGFLIVFWSAPTMTAGHLVFAAAATGYILVGIAFEERDLIQNLGEPYADYRAQVPALIPRPRLSRKLRAAGDMTNHNASSDAACLLRRTPAAAGSRDLRCGPCERRPSLRRMPHSRAPALVPAVPGADGRWRRPDASGDSGADLQRELARPGTDPYQPPDGSTDRRAAPVAGTVRKLSRTATLGLLSTVCGRWPL